MGKGRRRPYRVRLTTGWELNEDTGKQKQLYVTLGYYASRKEAMLALAAYHASPYDLSADKITFEDAYKAWSKKDYEERSYTSRKQLESAYKKCEPIYNMRMRDIKKAHMQDILDKYEDQSETAQRNIKTVMKNTFKYCMENDLINKDYTVYLTTKSAASEEDGIHTPYTAEEIAMLWDNLKTPVPLRHSRHEFKDVFPADIVLMLIYTGMRPSELLKMECANVNLEERCMVGGSKTEAGKNRVIPLHDDILPLVAARMELGNKYLITYKTDKPPTLQQFRVYMHDPLLVNKMDLMHLPHDGRHTFATFAHRFRIDKLIEKKIMGHAVPDITDGIYTHKDAQELVEEVNKIVFYEKH